jgi:hypothetical protein
MLKRVGLSYGAQLLGLGISFADRFFILGVLMRAWGYDLCSDWTVLAAAAGTLSIAESGLNI